MSDSALYTSLAFLLFFFVCLCAYIVKGKFDRKKNPNAYRWKPEQDYDVVLQGETPMTPGFPILKKRQKNGKQQKPKSMTNDDR